MNSQEKESTLKTEGSVNAKNYQEEEEIKIMRKAFKLLITRGKGCTRKKISALFICSS